MMKINKALNTKIISLLVAVLFLLNGTGYGVDIPRNTSPKLRIPIGGLYTYKRVTAAARNLADSQTLTIKGENFSYSYKLENITTSVQNALQNTESNRQLLEKLKIHFLFNLGETGDLKVKEQSSEPEIQILPDNKISIKFNTPLRNIAVFIDSSKNKVEITGKIHWDVLTQDKTAVNLLVYDNISLKQCESSYITWKLAMWVTTEVAKWLGAEFSPETDFYEEPIQEVIFHKDVIKLKERDSLIKVTIPSSRINVPSGYVYSPENPIYVLLKNHRSALGWVYEVVPAVKDEKGIHFLINGFQTETVIEEIFSFNNTEPMSWPLTFQPVIKKTMASVQVPELDAYTIIGDGEKMQVVSGPMVRGSGVESRTFWSQGGISETYTEMVSIGDLYIPKGKTPLTTFARLEWLGGFGRLKRSKLERKSILQLIGPHYMNDEKMFKLQFENDENIIRTYVRAAWIAKKWDFLKLILICVVIHIRS
jgi:hypothetical protein